MLYPFEDQHPQLDDGVFVAPSAMLVGDIRAGVDSSFWYNVVARGDVQPIEIGERVNIQDLTMIHATHGQSATVIADDVTVGHRAILHGCHIGRAALIGMGAIILDGARIGEEAMIGAGALVPPNAEIPPRTLSVGSPARVKRELTEAEVKALYRSASHYVEIARRHRASLEAGGHD